MPVKKTPGRSAHSGSALDSYKLKAKLLQKAKMRSGKPIQLKDAYEILAKSAGFKSWRSLKELFDATELYCPRGSSVRWKTWVKSYDEAMAIRAECDGYLLPYRDHFFVCEIDYVEYLGIGPTDTDLKAVGKNWVEPLDARAFERMRKKILDFKRL